MNSITVTFEKQGEKYTRHLTFPDGKRVTEKDIEIKKQWHSPETWQWSKPLHEYSREELARIFPKLSPLQVNRSKPLRMNWVRKSCKS